MSDEVRLKPHTRTRLYQHRKAIMWWAAGLWLFVTGLLQILQSAGVLPGP